jgi:hypothetical protein
MRNGSRTVRDFKRVNGALASFVSISGGGHDGLADTVGSWRTARR